MRGWVVVNSLGNVIGVANSEEEAKRQAEWFIKMGIGTKVYVEYRS